MDRLFGGGKRVFPALLFALIAVAGGIPRAEACSICRCGDPTFNALGPAGYTASGWRLAVDWERFHKDEGDPADEQESMVEHRVTALASYGFRDRFVLVARIPWSHRELTANVAGEEPEVISADGLSDPEFSFQARLWASPLSSGLGRRTSLSLVAGVKTPWGENDATGNGERLDEHAQPGTGSTDLFGSLAVLHLIDPDSSLFASAGYRRTGDNGFGYRYGSAVLANLAYERSLGSRVEGVLELNFRHAQKDRLDADGSLGADTGGSLLYVTPRVLVDLGHGFVLRAAAQIPAVRHLNGVQTERVVANVGLTYLLSP